MLMRRLPQKTDLFSVTATPFADQQVQPQSEPFRRRKGMIEHFGLRSRRFTAIGRKHRVARFYFLNKTHFVAGQGSCHVDLSSEVKNPYRFSTPSCRTSSRFLSKSGHQLVGAIIWYDYPGKLSGATFDQGTEIIPTVEARQMPDGTTSYASFTRNAPGNPLLPPSVGGTAGPPRPVRNPGVREAVPTR